MIARLILAEHGDVEIVESDSGQKALLQVRQELFDLVICDSDLGDMDITVFRYEMVKAAVGFKAAELIALCNTAAEAARLADAGFKHITAVPFDPAKFVVQVNSISDPRQWRQNERFHIPYSKVVLSVWGMEAEAKMINISRGGVLIEISGDRSELLLQNNPKLALKIKGPNGYCHIPYLPAKLTRLNAIGWNDKFKPTVMRVAFVFLPLNRAAEAELEQVLQMAKEDRLFADGG